MPMHITIDGPVAAGKTSTAKALANELKMTYLDTGALYRTVALYLQENQLGPEDCTPETLSHVNVQLGSKNSGDGLVVFLNGKPVDDAKLRTPEISKLASDCSAVPAVRDRLLDVQRNIAAGHKAVLEGRDTGTVVLPDAKFKFYLTADLLTRAHRRYVQDRARWPQGKLDPDEILKDMQLRDSNDMGRAVAPLAVPPGAVIIDNTNLSLPETVYLMAQLIRFRNA